MARFESIRLLENPDATANLERLSQLWTSTPHGLRIELSKPYKDFCEGMSVSGFQRIPNPGWLLVFVPELGQNSQLWESQSKRQIEVMVAKELY